MSSNPVKNKNRLYYIEPNDIPQLFVGGGIDCVGKNITWPQEDLNIVVDLQVEIPSRKYKQQNHVETYRFSNSTRESILSGVKINGSSFLTDNYLMIGAEDIKKNLSSDKELLCINSINIKFDTNLYPIVNITFTDVRGSALMTPNAVENENSSEISEHFFKTFFHFPYPKFYLTIKGIYGTCSTFILTVQDFKAKFNSDSGNFDVTINFIGLMYGLYTDLPLNLLILAPYINKKNSEELYNDYWLSNTSEGGRFFFKEGGLSENKICTFIDFYEQYKRLKESGDTAQEESSMRLAYIAKNIAICENLIELTENLENYILGLTGTNYTIDLSTGKRLVFCNIFDDQPKVGIEESFLNNYRTLFKEYKDTIQSVSIDAREEMFLAFIAEGVNDDGTNIYGNVIPFEFNDLIQIYTNYKTNRSDYFNPSKDDNNMFLAYGVNETEAFELADKIIENHYSNDIANNVKNYKFIIAYNKETLINYYQNSKSWLETLSVSATNQAAEDLKRVFKAKCGFLPTIENVMRMLFAHIDTFFHELYSSVIEQIPFTERTLNYDSYKETFKTDVNLNGTIELPPFTGFYKKQLKNDINSYEEINPGGIANPDWLKNILEEKFVNNLLNVFKLDFLEAQKTAQEELGLISAADIYISPTDFFYKGSNPYNYIKNSYLNTVYKNPYTLFYFILCRLKVFVDSLGGNNYTKDNIQSAITYELNALVDSVIFPRIINDDRFNGINGELIFNNVVNINPFIFDIKKDEKNEETLIISKHVNGFNYYRFEGTSTLLGNYTGYSRENLIAFELSKDEYNEGFFDKVKNNELLKNRVVDNFTLKSDSNESILQLLINGEAAAVNEYWDVGRWDGTYDIYKYTDCAIRSRQNIKDGSNKNVSIDFLLKNINTAWIPFIPTHDGYNVFYQYLYYTKATGFLDIADGDQVLYATKKTIAERDESTSNLLYYHNEKLTNEQKGFWFLACYVKQLKPNLLTISSGDFYFKTFKSVLLFIGGKLKSEKENWEFEMWGPDDINEASEYVNIKDLTDEQKRYFIEKWDEWAISDGSKKFTWAYLYNLIQKENNEVIEEDNRDGYTRRRYTLKYDDEREFGRAKDVNLLPAPTENLKKTELQSELFYLLEGGYYHFNTTKGYDISIKKDYLNFLADLFNKYRRNKSASYQTSISDAVGYGSGNVKIALYYTLKNLYDRWLASNTEENFKLNFKSSSAVHSEFDDFLYIDSFYNNIGSSFFVNVENFYNTIRDQIAGVTNYNLYEYIGKICFDNKLILRSLPVRSDFNSFDGLVNMFRPLSLYDANSKLQREYGNTYILMYPYEPSSKLNLTGSKEYDISFSDDGIKIIDPSGLITEEAANFFAKTNNNDNSVYVFGVTPCKQSQSYFTNITVGMDNPKVTDYSIKNTFLIAGIGSDNSEVSDIKGKGTGQDLFSIYSNRSYDCSVEMLGCINITPMMYFQLNNIPMFNGLYIITNVEHNIRNNSMTTKFVGTRMSKYTIPYNEEVFNTNLLKDAVDRYSNTNFSNVLRVGSNEIILNGDGFSYNENISKDIPQPKSEPNRVFYVWAAVSQMYQSWFDSDSNLYSPATCGSNSEYKKSNALCATAVEHFLMAGFNGLFGANTKKQDKFVNEMRSGAAKYNEKTYKRPDIDIVATYSGKNGYDMKDKLAELGFYCIAAGIEEFEKTPKQAGDVYVLKTKEYEQINSNGERKHCGHVAMYEGNFWVSDFKQAHWNIYRGSSKKHVSDAEDNILLYRYPNSNLTARRKIYSYFIDDKLKIVDTEDDAEINNILKEVKSKSF